MIVNSTDFKNNLGKYLRISAREEVIVTSNGRKVAKLIAYDAPKNTIEDGALAKEGEEAYQVSPQKVSYEEFVKLSENSEERYEYIDGEIYFLAAPKVVHQKILGELYLIFCHWFQGKKCRPFFAPFDITLKRNLENINVVQPDLIVICDLEENLNEKGYYMGVPALVVEIISESTRSKDFIKKLDLYMSTGVKEYWIVNPINREVTVYLFEEGNINQNATYKNGETAASYCFAGLEAELGRIFG